jgi:branched-chain amino acid transport system ATP-binding protein
MSLLEVTGLTRSFRSVIAVDQLDLAIAPDETVSVIGPNGVGKTTLFKFARAPYFAAMFAAQGIPCRMMEP